SVKDVHPVSTYQVAEKTCDGRHEVDVGVDFDHRSYAGISSWNPVQVLRKDGTLAQETTCLPGTAQNASDTAVAEFLQDHWVLNSNWAVDLASRLSSEIKGWFGALAPRAGVCYSSCTAGSTFMC